MSEEVPPQTQQDQSENISKDEQETNSNKTTNTEELETKSESNSNENDKVEVEESTETPTTENTDKPDTSEKNEDNENETKSDDTTEKNEKQAPSEERDEMDTLARDIFGSSDEEGEMDFKPDATNDKDMFDVSDEENLERETKEQLKKLAKKKDKKKKRKSREDGEGETSRKKKSKKSKSDDDEGKESDSIEDEKSPTPGRKKKEKSEIDKMFEGLRAGKSRRRKKEEGTDLEMHTLVDDMKVRMDTAADLDRKANEEKEPALHKVKILEEVVNMLEKKHLQDIFLESDILSSIRKWLEPLPDGSLVNMKIRENLLRILLQFPYLDVDTLSNSGIGKVIMFLYRHQHENATNKKMAKQLIERWSRPIFGISARYKDLESEEQTKKKEQRRESLSKSVDFEAELDKAKTDKQSPKYHARIPEKIAFDFKVRPKSQISIDDIKKKPKRQIEKSLMKKGGSNARTKNIRSMRISIEGRNMPS